MRLGDYAHRNVKLQPFDVPRDRTARRRYEKNFHRLRSGHLGANAQTVRRALNAQLDIVTDRVRRVNSRYAIMDAVDRGVDDMRPVFEESIRRVYERVVVAFASYVNDAVKQDDPSESEWLNAARSYVTTHAGVLIAIPHATTRRIVQDATVDAVRRGIENGWSIPKIADEIRAGSADAVSARRAVTIARTETIRASNFGAITGARTSGVARRKEWMTAGDDRVREDHAVADGQIVPLNGMFTIGGYPAEYPGDPRLPADLSINCRCVVGFLTD